MLAKNHIIALTNVVCKIRNDASALKDDCINLKDDYEDDFNMNDECIQLHLDDCVSEEEILLDVDNDTQSLFSGIDLDFVEKLN